ncbi:hypothetical protein [Mycolicibacterium septicum]|uniref:hypothetical protein n=1 Tax=Mycolicibacterium septicum TaxID=98668 RepID=UPI001AFB966C|nr:hypothetical protein [Mycolicibacterium septicum]QRY49880.1 hypothetical protein JVX95_20345 [Mycolicibacterium septicum]
MATSSTVFVVLVVVATMVPIAVFAWVTGNKRDKERAATPDNVHQSVKQDPPQFPQREAWTSAATRHRTPLSSSTTQWDRADTMDTVPQPPQAHTSADRKQRQDN